MKLRLFIVFFFLFISATIWGFNGEINTVIPRMLTVIAPGNWVYNAFDTLVTKGILKPSNLYSYGKIITRRDAAILSATALTFMDDNDFVKEGIERDDLVTVQRLIIEFADELSGLFGDEISGITRKVTRLERKLDLMPTKTHIRVETEGTLRPKPPTQQKRQFDFSGSFELESQYLKTRDMVGFSLDNHEYDRHFNEFFRFQGRVDEKVSKGETPSRIDMDFRGRGYQTHGIRINEWNIRWRDDGHDLIAGNGISPHFSPLTISDLVFEGADWTYNFKNDVIRGIGGNNGQYSSTEEIYGLHFTRKMSQRFTAQLFAVGVNNHEIDDKTILKNEQIMSFKMTGGWDLDRDISFEIARSQNSIEEGDSFSGVAYRIDGGMGFKRALLKGAYTVTDQDFLTLNNAKLMPQKAQGLYERKDGELSFLFHGDEGITLNCQLRKQNRNNSDSDCDLMDWGLMLDLELRDFPKLVLYSDFMTDKGVDMSSGVDIEENTFGVRSIFESIKGNYSLFEAMSGELIDYEGGFETVTRTAAAEFYRVLPKNWDGILRGYHRWTERNAFGLIYDTTANGGELGAGYNLREKLKADASFGYEKSTGYDAYNLKSSKFEVNHKRNAKNQISGFFQRQRKDDLSEPINSYIADIIGIEWKKTF